MKAQLWVPGPLPGMNELIAAAKGSGGRGAGYARLKRQWTDVVVAKANEAKLPKFPSRVRIFFRWLERDKRRDPDNVAAGGRKLILDGLVAAGVLKGDGWRYMATWTDMFDVYTSVPLCREPGVELTIEHAAGADLMAL